MVPVEGKRWNNLNFPCLLLTSFCAKRELAVLRGLFSGALFNCTILTMWTPFGLFQRIKNTGFFFFFFRV